MAIEDFSSSERFRIRKIALITKYTNLDVFLHDIL
jgi:hypothetical protein